MAILASLLGVIGRFAGKIVNAALGWATILLFGRVPQSKQILLSFVTLGSLAWLFAALGVIVPGFGAFMLAFAPIPKSVDQNLVRLVMLVVALVLPIFVGVASLFIVPKEERPTGKARIVAIGRGYLFCLVLAVMLVFLAAISLVRKARTISKRWEDAHVPIVVKPGHYDGVVTALRESLDGAGLGVGAEPAPRVLALPAHILAAAAGSGVRDMVPDRLMELKSGALEILVYPSDIAIGGSKQNVARARAAIASRLTTAPAYLTTTEEAQKVEDRIESIAGRGRQAIEAGASAAELAALRHELEGLDPTLASLIVPYDEWEVLYRMRLQVARELLTGQMPGETLGAGQRQKAPQPASRRADHGVGRRQSEPVAAFGRVALQWAAALLGLVLIGLDVVLTAAERIAPPRARPALSGRLERLTKRLK